MRNMSNQGRGMKVLQRRVKSSSPTATSTANGLAKRIRHYQNILWTRWQVLSARDQLALGVLSLFLLLLVGGYGGYSVHQAAKNSKENYQAQVADYFWLRSQAGNIDSSLHVADNQDGASQPPASRANALLSASGINDAQVVAMDNTVQLSFTHPSQAVVSTTLAQFEQQGWQLTQLSIQQDALTQHLQVQAALSF